MFNECSTSTWYDTKTPEIIFYAVLLRAARLELMCLIRGLNRLVQHEYIGFSNCFDWWPDGHSYMSKQPLSSQNNVAKWVDMVEQKFRELSDVI